MFIMTDDLHYGLNDIIQMMRPGAVFTVYNNKIVDWQDPSGLPAPSWEEILERFKVEEETIKSR